MTLRISLVPSDWQAYQTEAVGLFKGFGCSVEIQKQVLGARYLGGTSLRQLLMTLVRIAGIGSPDARRWIIPMVQLGFPSFCFQ